MNIPNQISEFYQILQLENPPVEYELWSDGISLKMKNHRWPMSLMEPEFNFIKDLIIRYDLKRGYEVATGFGVSSVAAGLGFKKTGGFLITMDSYVEENSENFFIYRNSLPKTFHDTDGYKSLNFLLEKFDLKNHVIPTVGWSPDDVDKVLSPYKTFKFDYAFIDGGHFPEQIIKDVEAIIPFLDEKFVIVFHDTFDDYFTPEVMNYLKDKFGKLPEIKVPAPNGCNTSVIINK
jgi:hypothetical protein